MVLLLALIGCSQPVVEGDAPGECSDGVDNDQNGSTDCDDPRCAAEASCADASSAPLPGGDTPTGGSGGSAGIDSDGDGLSDQYELSIGTDPNLMDTDGDTYLDPWELTEGTDPTDPHSRIYQGYWPYNPDKDLMPGTSAPTAELGAPFQRLQLVDQYGDTVDLYDFAYAGGVPVVIMTTTTWVSPGQTMSKWITGMDSSWNDYWPSVPRAVEAGELLWITVLVEDGLGGSPDEATCADYDATYPHDLIPVLADGEAVFVDYVQLNFWPHLILLDEAFVVEMTTVGSYEPILDELENRF